MIADAIRAILELGVTSQKVQKIELDDPSKLLLRLPGVPDLLEVAVPPPKRGPSLFGIDDFVEYVKRLSQAPEVYHGLDEVVAFLDARDRRERVRLGLIETGVFGAISELDELVRMQPKDWIKWLRLRLGSAVPPLVLQTLRRIDFTRTSTGKSVVEHGKESLGRSVEQAVQQADQIPESFIVSVPVYENPGFGAWRAAVEIVVHIDLESQVIDLRPGPDALGIAVQQVQGYLHTTLVDRLPGVPIFYGVP